MVDVSIIVTCFNKEEYLKDALDSVFRQTKQPKEVILVHDGCSEAQSYINTETVILKRNYGVSYARHKGFINSTGKLLLFLDGDDVLSPDYVEKTILTIYDGADIAYRFRQWHCPDRGALGAMVAHDSRPAGRQ